MELLGQGINAFVILKDAAKLTSKSGESFTLPPAMCPAEGQCARHACALLTLILQQPWEGGIIILV